MPHPPKKTSDAALETAQRQERILNYRLAGIRPAEIARLEDCDRSTVTRAIQRSIREMVRGEKAEQLAVVELARLEEATAAIWPRVVRGDLPAINTFLNISKRRSEIAGLDAPAKRPIDQDGNAMPEPPTVNVTQVVANIMALTADDPEQRYQLAAKLEARALASGD